MDALKALLKQPYWVLALVFGVAPVGLPCLAVDEDYHLTSHPPTTRLPVVVGIRLLVLSHGLDAHTWRNVRATRMNVAAST
jgi:hypothetical protein